MNLMHEINALLTISWDIMPNHGKCVEPHGKIMEVLPITVGFFTDANAPRPPKNAFNFCHQPFGLIKEFVFSQCVEKGNQEYDPESVRPKIPKTVGPDMLRPH